MEGGEGMGFLSAMAGLMGMGVVAAAADAWGFVVAVVVVVVVAAWDVVVGWPSVDDRSEGPPPALPVAKGR